MRALFTVSGWPAHYFPMVPLGWALRAAGHEVLVACPPGEAATVAAAGLPAAPVLGETDMTYLARHANLWAAHAGRWEYPWPPLHPDTGEPVDLATFDLPSYADQARRRIAASIEAGFDGALALAGRWHPDLILHDRLSADGLLAAKVLGVPSAACLWGPVGTAETEPGLFALPVDYTGAFSRLGAGTLDADAISHVIDPCPDALAPPVRGARIAARYLPYNGPGAPQPRLTGASPRVCVVWSDSMRQMYGEGACLLPRIAAALAPLEVDVLLPVHPDDEAGLGNLPARIRRLPRTPLHLLLPSCAAVVHHGGAGCAMTALAAGVPQLSLTFGAEQHAIGKRLAASGAGRWLPGHDADPAAIAGAVSDLLSGPGYAAAARELAAANAARPAPAEVAILLTDLALAC